MVTIAVASGKGGTGKSTVAVNLALLLSKGNNVSLFDLDVEEPNDNQFLNLDLTHLKDVNLLKPEIDEKKCTHCGICADLCEFNALAVLPSHVMTFPELCHSCGLCSYACPEQAITEVPHLNGIIEQGVINDKCSFFQGTLKISEAIATLTISELKSIAKERQQDIRVLDLPPGSSCPVIEGLKDTDYIILVTEPTPAGEHDLKIAIEVVKLLKVPFGIIINRFDVGDDRIEKLATNEDYKILLRIPHSDNIIYYYSRGMPLIDNDPESTKLFSNLISTLKEENVL